MASPELDQLGWKDVAYLLGYIVLALLSWIFRSALRRIEGRVDVIQSRVDVLGQETVRKEEFNKEVKAMRTEHLSMHEENKQDRRSAQEETRELLARIEGKIDVGAQAVLAEQVRAIAIELGKVDVYANETKHNYVDPLVRDVERLKSRVDRLMETK